MMKSTLYIIIFFFCTLSAYFNYYNIGSEIKSGGNNCRKRGKKGRKMGRGEQRGKHSTKHLVEDVIYNVLTLRPYKN